MFNESGITRKIAFALVVVLLVSCSSKKKNSGSFKVVDGKEFFFNGDEQIVDRLIMYDGEEYFIKNDGTKAKNEWVQIDNDGTWWAFFGARGIMVKNALWTIGNNLFIFDKDGRLKKDGLIEFNNEMYYATKDGYLLKEQLKVIDDKVLYFDKDGKQINVATLSWVENKNSNGLSDLPTGWYVLKSNGELVKSTWNDGYYLGDNGLMVTDKWIGEGEDRIYIGPDGKKETDYKEVKNLISDILGGTKNSRAKSTDNHQMWELKYYVDSFNEHTDEKYLRGDFVGQFDNIVTIGSKCDFVFLIDDYVYIVLYEYGNVQVKNYNYSSDKMYDILLRTNSGIQVGFVGIMSDDRVRIDEYGSKYIVDCLKRNESFKLVVEEVTSNTYITPSKYLVEVMPGNFNSLYWK